METLIRVGFPEAFADKLITRLSETPLLQRQSAAADSSDLSSLLHITDDSRVVAVAELEPFERFWIVLHQPLPTFLTSSIRRDRVKSHRLAVGSNLQPLYHKDPALLNCIRHSYAEANCCSLGLLGDEQDIGLTLFWVTRKVYADKEMLCNWLHPMQDGTARFSATCLALCNGNSFALAAERKKHEDIVASTIGSLNSSGRKGRDLELKDVETDQVDTKRIVKVYSDLKLIADALPLEGGGVKFVCCKEQDDADIWHMARHVKGFKDLPKRILINQFPYEGGFVRKDLLGQSIRNYCCGDSHAPTWFLPSFDLSTEFPQLLDYHRKANESVWVVKPAMGTRGAGIEVTDSIAAIAESGCAPGGDRVAQLYVPDPLLLVRKDIERGVKFDCRTYVFVRGVSSGKPKVFVHRWYYARVAAREFELESSSLSDKSIHQTVRKYDADLKISEGESILSRHMLLKSMFISNSKTLPVPASAWANVEEEVVQMVREFFDGMSQLIFPLSKSRAIYGIDWAPNYEEGRVIPKMIEVNYCPDLSSIQTLYNMDAFLTDMLTCLYAPSVGEGNWTAASPQPEEPCLSKG